MGIMVITWVVAGLLVAGYVWFMVWRVRVERRKRAEKAGTTRSGEAATAAKLERILKNDVWPPPAADAPVAAAQVAPQPAESAAGPQPAVAPAMAGASTTPAPAPSDNGTAGDVTAALAGIRLPSDLVPLTTMTPRPGIDDRVAFWTNGVRADDVGASFATELERLGYAVKWVEERTLTAERESNRLIAVVHADADKAVIDDKQAFSSVPEEAVVVEVWRQPY